MSVIEIIKILVELQNLESEIANLTKHKDRLPFQLKSSQNKLDDENENLKKINQEILKNQKVIKSSEAECANTQKKINDVRKQQNGSKSNKEYKTFSEVIEKYQSEIEAQEDIQLTHYDKIEKLEEKINQINEKLEDVNDQLKRRQEELEQNFASLESQINTLSAKREKLYSFITNEISEQFQKLIELRNGQAIASVEVINIEEGGNCTGCGTELIRPIIQKLLAKNEIVACPSCSRILYLPEIL